MATRISKSLAASPASQTPTKGRGSKHLNRKTVVDGITFDSAKEARRYGELRQLSKAGKVNGLCWQVAFPLEVNGVRVAKYVSDFVYWDEHGAKVVEDVKSPHTRKLPVYRLKAKMFAAQYGFPIREV